VEAVNDLLRGESHTNSQLGEGRGGGGKTEREERPRKEEGPMEKIPRSTGEIPILSSKVGLKEMQGENRDVRKRRSAF